MSFGDFMPLLIIYFRLQRLLIEVSNEYSQEQVKQKELPNDQERYEKRRRFEPAICPTMIDVDCWPSIICQYDEYWNKSFQECIEIWIWISTLSQSYTLIAILNRLIIIIKFNFICKEFHPKQRIDEHENQEKNWEIANVLHRIANSYQEILELLPWFGQLENSEKSKSSESRHGPWTSWLCLIVVSIYSVIILLDCIAHNDINQRYENNKRVEHVEIVSYVDFETKTCHLKHHF